MHKKQVLYLITKELLDKMNIENSDEIEEKLHKYDNLEMEYFVDYSGTDDCNECVAHELFSDYGADCGEFGRSRFLKPSDLLNKKSTKRYSAKQFKKNL